MSNDPLDALVRDFRGERADLIPILQRTQAAYGFLSSDSLRRISRRLRMSENEIYGVATFFTQFRFQPPGRQIIKVCLGTACHVNGGEQMLNLLERRLEIKPGETTPDREYQLERVACLGCCALAPVVTLNEKIYSEMSVLRLQGILDEREQT